MGAMDAFLTHLDDPEIRASYDGLTERWDARVARLNAALAAEQLPVRLANLARLPRSATRRHRAITGCSSSISAPPAWP